MHSLRYNVHFGLTNRQGTGYFCKIFSIFNPYDFLLLKIRKEISFTQEVIVGKIVVHKGVKYKALKMNRP